MVSIQVLLYNSHNLVSVIFLHTVYFYLTHRYDPIRCNHSGSEQTSEQWQWRDTPHTPNLQSWSLAIRWFNVISRTLIWSGWSYLSAEMQLVYSTSKLTGLRKKEIQTASYRIWTCVTKLISYNRNHVYLLFYILGTHQEIS